MQLGFFVTPMPRPGIKLTPFQLHLRNLIPGCFTDRATAAVAKKVLEYFSTFWSFLAFGRSVPTLQNKFQPVWKAQVIHQEGAAVRRNLLPKLKPR